MITNENGVGWKAKRSPQNEKIRQAHITGTPYKRRLYKRENSSSASSLLIVQSISNNRINQQIVS